MKRKRSENYDTLVRIVLLILMLVTFCFIMRGGKRLVSSVSSDTVETSKERLCVMIDAGHGGGR